MSLRDSVDAVDALLIDDAEPDEGYEAEPPELGANDLIRADQHLRAIARITRDRDDFVEVANAEIVRLGEAIAEINAAADRQVAWHAEVLERFHRAVLSLIPQRLTIKLPHGELVSRKQQPVWTWEADGTVFRDWCVQNQRYDLLNVQPAPLPKVAVAEAKKALTQPIVDEAGREVGAEYGHFATGEIPPGVSVDLRDRSFTYKLR
jgi:Bacteriophage Mu Gam like protein